MTDITKKRWRVSGVIVGSKYLGEVEASTKEEAEDKALRRAHVSLCHQCSKQCSDPDIEEAHAEEIEDD